MLIRSEFTDEFKVKLVNKCQDFLTTQSKNEKETKEKLSFPGISIWSNFVVLKKMSQKFLLITVFHIFT